ncbi:MAG: S8 family peptidase [Cyclobacteriaceae bacterium]|nr:S8 family peptidase [Cyclobacteriaceae bacterium]
MRSILISFIFLSLLSFNNSMAQDNDSTIIDIQYPDNWFNLDPEEDSVLGISTEKAYRTILKNKSSKNVVVAVIDSGIDIEHEDLQGSIWVNDDEIADNGIDDDNNGYIDDIHGWNFIGNADGENIESDSYELTREYVRLGIFFGNKDSLKLRRKNKEKYKYYKELEKQFMKQKTKFEEEYAQFSNFYKNYKFAKEILLNFTSSDTLTIEVINKIDTNSNEQLAQIINFYKNLLEHNINDKEVTNWQEHLEKQLNFAYNVDFDPRGLVGDNYEDLNEKYYGNNNVEGPDASHGTHVAGIIAANRNNKIGIQGIGDNVSIMSIRAVPDGDERDKDIANAIYYAVDNGAKIINMSFGKSFSPQKEAVDNAVKYAEEKGVLLIHAAGNSSKDIDVKDNFPTKKFLDEKSVSQLWIEVGASNSGINNAFVGSFSNYGSETVNIFAPGCQITSTTPDDNYEAFDGTSMASPVTAGVAALLMSYYPQLNSIQIKDILLKSSKKYENLEVIKPSKNAEKQEKVLFSELSISGAIINAYEAVKMAESMLIDSNK